MLLRPQGLDTQYLMGGRAERILYFRAVHRGYSHAGASARRYPPASVLNLGYTKGRHCQHSVTFCDGRDAGDDGQARSRCYGMGRGRGIGKNTMSAFISGGDIWSKIEFDLSECRDLFHMLHETKYEAKGKKIPLGDGKAEWRDTAPRWMDDEHGASTRPWLMIPHVDAVDHEAIYERLKAGKHLLNSIEQRVSARELTPELIHDWGLLNRWAGALELVYQMEPDARLLRSGDDNLDFHKRWFAHYYLMIQPLPKREDALEVMEEFVNTIIKDLPDGPERQWFSKFLGSQDSDSLEDSRRLTKTFRGLSVRKMKKLATEPLDSVPAFALVYPPPLGGG